MSALNLKRRFLLVAFGASVALAVGVAVVAASPGPMPPPTGERAHAQSVLEPVFNAENYGQIGYVSTPNGTQHPVPSNPKSWSPIYVVEYPTNSTINTSGTGAAGPLNCWHTPIENCPTHGNGVAGAAASVFPSVYGRGVLGHDHVMDWPGGADWNVAWEPVVVLFTNSNAANTRLLTDAQIDAAVEAGDAIKIPLPEATFHCALVSDSVWALTTPFTG
jgi:hypothetical protein